VAVGVGVGAVAVAVAAVGPGPTKGRKFGGRGQWLRLPIISCPPP
jgi:hypothetical protein